ncbi:MULTISPECIES: glycosyltransferase family 4 protein [Flavobacteriaceae]|uniref:glycosyltransferase family 4 protein n=1 Tax=Flavobacteriaceae TaxID=49546 RepID=UPI003AA7D5FC
MSKVLNNVLRVTPSFASYTNPGSGSNAYFHSKYSKYKSYILTEEKKLDYLNVNENVKIKTIKTLNNSLGELGDKKFIFNLFNKFISTCLFTLKSIKFIHSVKPELVHLYSPIYIFTGLYCKIIFGSKIVMTIHGTDGLRIQNFKFLQLIFSLTDLNLSLSKKFIENMNREDILFLGNGFDNSVFYLNERISRNREKYILTVGNLRWQKDHLTMIKAFKIFQKNNKDYKLFIIGEGELRNELENEISKLKLSENVFLLGKKDQASIAELMNISEMFFLSSKTEGSPKVIFEAMACGLPILSTNVGDVKENTCRNSGLIVNNDIDSIAKGLSEIINDRSFDRAFISENIKIKSWEYVSKNLDKIYERITE